MSTPTDGSLAAAVPSRPTRGATVKALVGRDREMSLLLQLLGASDREPGVIFVTGEAGIGKTRLVQESLGRSSRPVLRGETSVDPASPYAPIIQALRDFGRDHLDVLMGLPLTKHLGPLLPELDLAETESDPPTLSAAICDALEAAGGRDAVLLLEDLHWADSGTLDVLLEIARVPERSGLSVICTYRNDELSRLHRLRRTRSELKRAGRLHEIVLRPMSLDEVSRLAEDVAGSALSEDAVGIIFERSDGIPFFVEELASSLAVDRASDGSAGPQAQEPPETLKDAIRLRASSLDPPLIEVLEVMAVAGISVDLPLLASIVDPDSVTALIEHGWPVVIEGGTASFRHALVRDAIYSDIPWLRRRERHRFLAEELEARGAAPEDIAHHWVSAREPLRARPHLLRAARSFCSIHAYRDARELLLEAMKEWPGEEAETERLDALELLAGCSELCGDADEGARLWQQVSSGREQLDDAQGSARARRRLATLLEMRGDWDDAVTARMAAAEGFDRSALPAEAATERLTAAAHLTSAGDTTSALALVQQAARDAEVAGDNEVKVRVLALEGEIRAKLGEPAGVQMAREALGLALSEEYTAATAEAYYRLAAALEHDAQYVGAVDTYESGFAFCQKRGLDDMGDFCLACMTPVMRHIGRWKEASTVCRNVMRKGDAPPIAHNVASGELGLIEAIKGNVGPASRFLGPALAFARANDVFGLVVECSWGTAVVHALAGREEEASAIAGTLVEECLRREEWHYSVSAMRWCSMWFSDRGDEAGLLSAVNVVSNAATQTGSQEAKATLAYGLVEAALLKGDERQASDQAQRTLTLLEGVTAPYEVAEMRARCAVALAGGGHREAAIGLLTAAYRTAKKLGGRPLGLRIVGQFETLGEPVEQHLGRRATAQSERGGLSRRELDVLRYVSTGRTNKEIAEALFLSTRTVDMHVRSILMKLGCRTRAEAVRRAAELGLLGSEPENTA